MNSKMFLAIWAMLSYVANFSTATAQQSNTPTNQDATTTILVGPARPPEPAFLYSVNARAIVQVDSTAIEQSIELSIKVVQGKPTTLTLGLNGPGDVVEVTG